MIQHNISGVLPNFDALDIDNDFRKRSSGYSALIWNQQMLEMESVQKIKTPLNLFDTVSYQNNNGNINQVYVPKIFGWKLFNSDLERAILVNISQDTININTSSILPENSNWVQWSADSLYRKIDDGSNLQKDTILNNTKISLLPYSINMANSFCYNDVDNDGVCDHLEQEGCSQDLEACNYNPIGTQDCIYPVDIYGLNYLDCVGLCINDNDIYMFNLFGDGVCDEVDNCPDVYNPDQIDNNQDGIGDACDGLNLNIENKTKKILKSVDVLGRVGQEKGFLIYFFEDGSVIKKYK